MEIRGRVISKGDAEGEALITKQPISFFGGVDPDTGIVIEKGHELKGKCIKSKVLIFPYGKGSTVGSYTLYRMKRNGFAPCAIINKECEPIVAVGAIISGIPLIDKLEVNIFEILTSDKINKIIKIDGRRGMVIIR